MTAANTPTPSLAASWPGSEWPAPERLHLTLHGGAPYHPNPKGMAELAAESLPPPRAEERLWLKSVPDGACATLVP